MPNIIFLLLNETNLQKLKTKNRITADSSNYKKAYCNNNIQRQTLQTAKASL